jgi:poly-D-alanine transfer protein DltD
MITLKKVIKTIRANEAGLDLEEDDKSVYIYQDNIHFFIKTWA